MYIAILGRQPELGFAELQRIYKDKVARTSKEACLLDVDYIDIDRLGGTVKLAKLFLRTNNNNWHQASETIKNSLIEEFKDQDRKITLGISAYDLKLNSKDVNKLGLAIKKGLKKHSTSIRIVPNQDLPYLSSATSFHNKLDKGDNKIELVIVKDQNEIIVGKLEGVQNISAYAMRDQKRPKRDAFVGMLPPKLAQIMINLALGNQEPKDKLLLDPFCGTGVLLQEALLIGLKVYGTDLSQKMIDYTKINLDWITNKKHLDSSILLEQGDAMTHKWQTTPNFIATETYLGQPFSAIPSKAKLDEVRKNCDHIVSSFLINLKDQISKDTTICLGVPAWRNHKDSFTRLNTVFELEKLGYKKVLDKTLIYARKDQIVARDILVLKLQ